jgi:ankyrin repeat protein
VAGIIVAENMGREAQIGKYGGKTALGLAARDGNLEAVKALLDGGADVNQRDAADNSSALLIASINGQFDVAKLLERGADVNTRSDSNNSPLFSVINAQWTPKSRHPEPADYMQQTTSYMDLVQLMLDKGADVNARLNYDLWFIELGSGYLTLDWTGATPFFRATHALDLPLMKLLVQYGADATLGTVKTATTRAGRPGPGGDPSGLPPVENGQTAVYPIHVASGHAYGDQFVANVHRFVEGEWLNVVKYLVEEHGADVNTRDFQGESPIHNAAARGDNELIKYLVSKGGDVMAIDRKGRTTVDMANGPQQRVQPIPETIKLLESMGAKNNNNCVSC